MLPPTILTDMGVQLGSVVIKNNSGTPYVVAECGSVSIDPDEILDICALDTPGKYEWEAANRLVTAMVGSQLYQDIQSGDIQVVTNRAPT